MARDGDGSISNFSTGDLKARRGRGESRTDLLRVRAKTADQLEQDIASDPDFEDVPADWYLAAQAVMPTPKASFAATRQ